MELTAKYGYARVKDVAQALGTQSSAASKMIPKLHQEGILEYWRYRGFRMTQDSLKCAEELHERRTTIKGFWDCLKVCPSERIDQIIEGIVHAVSLEELAAMKQFVEFVHLHPGWWAHYLDWRVNETRGK